MRKVPSGFRVISLSFAFVLVIAGLLLVTYQVSGPIFEGYMYSEFLKNNPLVESIPNTLGRPFALIPNIIETFFFGLSKEGFFAVETLLLLSRGLVVLFSPIKNNFLKFSFSITVMLVPFWAASLNERFFAAQLSLTFSLLSIRFLIKEGTGNYLGGIFFGLATLTYPPVMLVVPIVWFILRLTTERFNLKQIVRSSQALTLSGVMILYFIWIVVLKALHVNSYDARMSGRPSILGVENLISTLSNDFPIKTLLILLFSVFILNAYSNNSTNKIKVVLISTLLLATPLTYLQASLHLNDPERVYFSVSSALICLFFAIFIIDSKFEFKSFKYKLLCILLIVSGVASYSSTYQYWIVTQKNNMELLSLTKLALKDYPELTKVRIEDFTGNFGDVNTFFGNADVKNLMKSGNSMLAALRFENSRMVYSQICTPGGVRRNHPASQVFPIPTTLNCEAVSTDSPFLNIKVLQVNPVRIKYEPNY